MYKIKASTNPCFADRTDNPVGANSKYGFNQLRVGYSVFIDYRYEHDFIPGSARTAANAINRKYVGKIRLHCSVIHLPDGNKQMEIARVE